MNANEGLTETKELSCKCLGREQHLNRNLYGTQAPDRIGLYQRAGAL